MKTKIQELQNTSKIKNIKDFYGASVTLRKVTRLEIRVI